MNKPLIAAILAAALVCGCSAPVTVDCNKLANNNEKDMCQYNSSMRQMSSVLCRDIINETMKAECINRIAVQLLDYLPCKQHDKQAAKDHCESIVSDARKKAREANPDARLP